MPRHADIAQAMVKAAICSQRQAQAFTAALATTGQTADTDIEQALADIHARLDQHDQQIHKALADAANGQVGAKKPGPKPKTPATSTARY